MHGGPILSVRNFEWLFRFLSLFALDDGVPVPEVFKFFFLLAYKLGIQVGQGFLGVAAKAGVYF